MESETLQSFGERAVLAGEHTCEPPPRDGAPRWPLSIVMMPPPDAAETVSALTRTAMELAGSHHLRSGDAGYAHITVRALENRRRVASDDPFAIRCAAALDRACSKYPPLSMRLGRVVVTPGGVLATLSPTSLDADRFRGYAIGEELGVDAFREGVVSSRDLWYVSLLHFRGRINRPDELVAWTRHRLAPAVWTFHTASICTYHVTETAMRPNIIHTTSFAHAS